MKDPLLDALGKIPTEEEPTHFLGNQRQQTPRVKKVAVSDAETFHPGMKVRWLYLEFGEEGVEHGGTVVQDNGTTLTVEEDGTGQTRQIPKMIIEGPGKTSKKRVIQERIAPGLTMAYEVTDHLPDKLRVEALARSAGKQAASDPDIWDFNGWVQKLVSGARRQTDADIAPAQYNGFTAAEIARDNDVVVPSGIAPDAVYESFF